ncbi:MAG: alpha/beta hydrolase [Lautropia sp.]|nr:alpha/beta hydrolase [Lautropia sp.]
MLTRMHPQLAAFFSYRLEQQVLLQQMEESGTVIPAPDIKGLRHWYRLFSQRVGGAVLPVAEIRNLVADTDERPIGLRLYRPLPAPPAPASAALSPALIYFHGGGWTTGDLDTHDRLCRRIAIATQAIVIAVDYALAPELPWPQAPHDCIATTRWVLRHAESLGINPTQIGVAGDSAGGNLAAVVALALKTPDPTGDPALACQILIYPATDLRSGFTPQYPSLHIHAERPPLSTAQMREHMCHYLGNRQDSAQHWQASPLLAASHQGAAPALIMTAELDPLLDDGTAYARALAVAGVEVMHRHYAGLTHGFIEMAGVLDSIVPNAISLMADWFHTCSQSAH